MGIFSDKTVPEITGVSVDPAESKYLFIDANPDLNHQGFGIALVGYDKTLPEYRIDREGFPCFGLEYLVDGEGEIKFSDSRSPLRSQVFFLYGPGVSHRITNDSKRPMKKYFIDFFGREAGEYLKSVGLSLGMCYEAALDNRIPILFEGILRDADLKDDGIETLEPALKLILSILGKATQRRAMQSDSAYQSYLRGRSFIEANFTKFGNVTDLAVASNISSAYLTRLFKRYSKETPYQLLLRLRMTHAGNLLVATRMSVQEVADASGFQDPFHFSHRFKQYFGVSPRAFKSRYQR